MRTMPACSGNGHAPEVLGPTTRVGGQETDKRDLETSIDLGPIGQAW